MAFLCVAVCMIGILDYTWLFPPLHKSLIMYSSVIFKLCYREVLFVEVNKFYYEPAIILLREKAFLT